MKFNGYVCEVCGTLLPKRSNRYKITQYTNQYDFTSAYVEKANIDLCESCFNKFKSWCSDQIKTK